MKIAVIGSRGLNSPEIKEIIKKKLEEMECTQVISGGSLGVSLLAEEVAREQGYKLQIHRPDYKTYGKVAPHVRSSLMISACEKVLCIWDGKSKGTSNELVKARTSGKLVKLIVYS